MDEGVSAFDQIDRLGNCSKVKNVEPGKGIHIKIFPKNANLKEFL